MTPKFCLKLFLDSSSRVEDEELIPIYHGWIRQRSLGGILIDVADYKHVPGGPGIMLVTHDAHFMMEMTGGRKGLMYQRRRPLDGADPAPAAAALEEACRHLEQEPALRGKIRFSRDEALFIVNDRLAATNTSEDFEKFRPLAEKFAAAIIRGNFTVERAGDDPRERLTYRLARL